MSKKATAATTAVQTTQVQATTAPSESHIDDSELFINTPIRTNLTDETWEVCYKSLPELPTHFEGTWLPEEVREDFSGDPGAYVVTAMPVPAVANTARSNFQECNDDDFGRDDVSQDPIVTLAACNDWLQLTYGHRLAVLAKLGIYVQARAIYPSRRQLGPEASVLLTVKDGMVGGEAGEDGELTFTFWEHQPSSVKLGDLTINKFQNMAQRFWRELPIVENVYRARAHYIAATVANPVRAMPDVEDKAGSMPYQWFTGDTLPETSETQCQYPKPKLLEMVNIYNQWVHDGF